MGRGASARARAARAAGAPREARRARACRKMSWSSPHEVAANEKAGKRPRSYLSASNVAGARSAEPAAARPSRPRRRPHGRGAALVADGGVHVDDMLAYARTRRARVIVVENVAEKDGLGAIETALNAVGGYAWSMQELCPHVHAGQPVRRARAFWVGVRHA